MTTDYDTDQFYHQIFDLNNITAGWLNDVCVDRSMTRLLQMGGGGEAQGSISNTHAVHMCVTRGYQNIP